MAVWRLREKLRLLLFCAFSMALGGAAPKPTPKSVQAPTPLPAFSLLQKVSLKLRGKAPSHQELAAFKQGIASHPNGVDGALADLV